MQGRASDQLLLSNFKKNYEKYQTANELMFFVGNYFQERLIYQKTALLP